MGKYLIGSTIFAMVACNGLHAMAQDGREAQMIGFRDFCEHGDKKACVKFGMMLQQNVDRHTKWRRSHPDWFFFEH